MHRLRLVFSLVLAAVPTMPIVAAPAPAPHSAAPARHSAAPLADLVREVNIPFEMFTLSNGLRVIVHTDRKAPVVGVTVYYRVGSKNEPKGKSGFAHLFEHLMFGGSENVPDFDAPLISAGSSQTNGSTWYDRTNYVETVPTGALDRALFMEADRMGRLLGAVTQAKLDAQRGVVQNEKRQGDNQPFGLVEYAQTAALFPADHPYGHTTIGSMTDLDRASLDDVRGWFRDNYGPNNAILSLAGDIDVATARAKVGKYFGSIPAGPKVVMPVAPVPTLPARVDATMSDRVATTRLYRSWTAPGLNHADAVPLAIGAAVLGGLSSSRLDNALVRKERLAVAVTAGVEQHEDIGKIEVTADVRPGVDPALVARRLDEIIAELIAGGPSADEVNRVATRTVSAEIARLEVVGGFGGKAATLAEGLLYSGDPAHYKAELQRLATATPAEVKAALGRWMGRPVYALTVSPGARSAYEESRLAGPSGTADTAPAANGATEAGPAAPKLAIPGVDPSPALRFPPVATRTLSNGIKVHFARRNVVPTVQMVMSFDVGVAAEPADKAGIGQLLLSTMEAGTTTRDAIAIAEEQERLGANISTGETMDRTSVSLYALSANLAPSLDLLADIIKHPSLDLKELERLRAIQLAAIDAERKQPSGMASRTIAPILYGADHPYGRPSRGLGTPATVSALTRADLGSWLRRWLRPEKAEIFVAGDVDHDALMTMLEAQFGRWASTRDVPPVKNLAAPVPPPSPAITLIDRPQSPQSLILGGMVTAKRITDDLTAFTSANAILGNDFTSRLNQDIREAKAWSYGVSAYLAQRAGPSPWLVVAPVQADRTGDAIAAIKTNVSAFLGKEGVSQEEFDRIVKGEINRLPGAYETTGAVLGRMQDDAAAGRPFDYVNGLAAKLGALDPAQLDAAIRGVIDPAKLSWVIVGDAKLVRSQLDALGQPVRVIDEKAAGAQ